MTKVTKGELAQKIGKSGAIVTRLINSGVLNSSFTSDGKKIYLEKAIKAIIMNKGIDYIKVDIDVDIDIPSVEEEKIYTAQNEEELQGYLDQEPSPSKKIDMMDKFWSYKIRQQKFLEADGQLISLSDAKAALEKLLTPLNQYLDDQSTNLKNHFPHLESDILSFIAEQNNRMKQQLRSNEWE